MYWRTLKLNKRQHRIELKTKYWIYVSILFAILFVTTFFNWKFEVIAFNPFWEEGESELKVMTWNVHCSSGADQIRQKKIAKLILKEDADLVLLNEFNLDSCLVIDSLLNMHYPYRNDANAKIKSGDIFYSKTQLLESDKFKKVIDNCIYSKLFIGKDSLYILGCHLPGNNHEGQIEIDDADSLRRVKTFWGHYRNAQEKRKDKAQFLKKTIQESTLPMIVLGDMNDFDASAPMDSLKEAGMKNAWWEGGFGYGATYHEGWLRLRIDHIYYNEKLKLMDVKVVKTDLSDHNILIADFSIAK